MSEVGKNIKKYRIRSGLTLLEVANKLGVQEATIQRYESGKIKNLKYDTIVSLSEVFHCTPTDLMGWTEENNLDFSLFDIPVKRTLPVLGEVACGEPILTNEEVEYVTLKDVPEQADFILIAKGDSMKNSRIYDGDYVFIHKQSSVQNGDIAVVIINDEATLKRVFFYPETNKLVLQPSNDDYEPLVYIGEELRNIRIIGKAIAFQGVL